MNDPIALAKQGKDRREAAERKKTLSGLAKLIGFESRMFSLEFKHNTKEELRYYLWQMELHKWLGELDVVKGFMVTNFLRHIDVVYLECHLTETLKILTDETGEE